MTNVDRVLEFLRFSDGFVSAADVGFLLERPESDALEILEKLCGEGLVIRRGRGWSVPVSVGQRYDYSAKFRTRFDLRRYPLGRVRGNCGEQEYGLSLIAQLPDVSDV